MVTTNQSKFKGSQGCGRYRGQRRGGVGECWCTEEWKRHKRHWEHRECKEVENARGIRGVGTGSLEGTEACGM